MWRILILAVIAIAITGYGFSLVTIDGTGEVGASAIIGSVDINYDAYSRATDPNYDWQFPEDHGPHPDFLTEWWYYTGNLEAENGQRFGFQRNLPHVVHAQFNPFQPFARGQALHRPVPIQHPSDFCAHLAFRKIKQRQGFYQGQCSALDHQAQPLHLGALYCRGWNFLGWEFYPMEGDLPLHQVGNGMAGKKTLGRQAIPHHQQKSSLPNGAPDLIACQPIRLGADHKIGLVGWGVSGEGFRGEQYMKDGPASGFPAGFLPGFDLPPMKHGGG